MVRGLVLVCQLQRQAATQTPTGEEEVLGATNPSSRKGHAEGPAGVDPVTRDTSARMIAARMRAGARMPGGREPSLTDGGAL